MSPRSSPDLSRVPESERFTAAGVASGRHRGTSGAGRAVPRLLPRREAASDRAGETGAAPRPSGEADGDAT